MIRIIRTTVPWIGLAFVVLFLGSFVYSRQPTDQPVVLHTFYGPIEVDDAVVMALLESKELQRLKGIHQYGVLRYATPIEDYTRYDHSIGVYVLLHKYGLPLEEQIAGLLHDTSHTVFSHVGDFVFNHKSHQSSYQDDIHGWYLHNSGLADLLERFGYSVDDIHHKDGHFKALEKDLPALCADRIDYNIQGGARRGLLSQSDVQQIMDELKLDENHQWYFTSAESARKLADVSLELSENLWGSDWSLVIYQWTAEAIRRAVDLKEISHDEIHFSTDYVIWQKLLASSDDKIKEQIQKVQGFKQYFERTCPQQRDQLCKGKFRGLDPLVMTDSGLRPLTQLDHQFADKYDAVQKRMQEGWSVRFLQPTPAGAEGPAPATTTAAILVMAAATAEARESHATEG